MRRGRALLAAILLSGIAGVWAEGEEAPAAAAAESAPSLPAAPSPAPASTLEELLERVRAGASAAAEVETARANEHGAHRDQQQAALDAVRAALTEAERRAVTLEKQWQKNQSLLGERQLDLDSRLGTLTDVFATLIDVGGDLRAHLHDSLLATQLGAERVAVLDALLTTAASGDRLVDIAGLDTLWYELQRELTESGRVRRYRAEAVAPDGARAPRTVIRAGTFNVVDEHGAYLLHDVAGGVLRELPRQDARAHEDAVAFVAGGAAHAPLALDPGGSRDAGALRAAVAAPSGAERLAALAALGWIALALGAGGSLFALVRLVALWRLRASAAAPLPLDHPLAKLDAVARAWPGLDPAALEYALHDALLRELPALGLGAGVLRAIGTLAPLLGVLGTVVELTTGAAEPAAGDLAQALLATVIGLCAGIPVLALHALLLAQLRDLGQRLDEHAAALVAARATGDDA